MVVVPTLSWKCSSSSRAEARSFASRFESGSSRRKTGRLADDRSGQGHALALAAGELAGLAVEELSDAEQSRGPLDLLAVLALRHFLGLEGKGDVLVDRQVGIEGVALEDHRDPPLPRRQLVDHSAADEDLARRRRFESRDHAEQGRFPGAGRSEEDEKFALLGREADVVDRPELARLEDLGQIPGLDDRHQQSLRTRLIGFGRAAEHGKAPVARCDRSLQESVSRRSVYFQRAKIRLYSASAAFAASSGFSSPRATLANIVGITHVLKASEMPAVA